MGLIKAGIGALGGTLADQWKEFFYCDSLDKEVLVVKGQKRTGSRSSNTKGSDNIISNGSGIAVADGQCMIIVEQGKIVEVCAEPGQFTYDTSTEPSIFAGNLGESIKQTFATIGKRFTYGGDTGKDQRVYYFNTKEIMDNKFGTPNPVLFRIVDSKIGLDMETDLRCSGVYSYKITDPLLFYTNVCANVAQEFRREEIDGQLKTEFVDALSMGLGTLSGLELRPSQIPAHTNELKDAMNDALRTDWAEKRGLSIVKIALNPVVMNEEDAENLKRYQRGAAASNNPGMAGGVFLESQGEAMRGAATNPNGAMGGFVGMGMAMNAGGNNTAQNLFAMSQQQQAQQAAHQPQPAAPNGWKCPKCGAVSTGNFCAECGAPKPEANGWTCTKCGTVNQGKFCMQCGAPKPAGAPLYKCDKCGWTPEDPHNPPKFCPQCGDPFDANDIS
ncbi:MAG: SPFH domain-containing protein [Clostridia bacterium]|nr:SPFH domain-containing protein [Clostridia bacterium]